MEIESKNLKQHQQQAINFAADMIVECLKQSNLGIQSIQQLNMYKSYVRYFIQFNKLFVEAKFKQYITDKLKKQ